MIQLGCVTLSASSPALLLQGVSLRSLKSRARRVVDIEVDGRSKATPIIATVEPDRAARPRHCLGSIPTGKAGQKGTATPGYTLLPPYRVLQS